MPEVRGRGLDYGALGASGRAALRHEADVCELCRGPVQDVDHDHATGLVRFVGCHSCNMAVLSIETGGLPDRSDDWYRRAELLLDRDDLLNVRCPPPYPHQMVGGYWTDTEVDDRRRGWARLLRSVIDLLEMEQFRHPEDRDRLNEVRALAQQQVSDDTGATRSRPHRIGKKGDIYPADPLVDRPDSELTQLWPERTDEQLDRAAGLEPFIAGLTGEQRIMVRLRYDAQMTQDEIADILHIDQSNVNRRLATIHKQLRAALLEAFVPEAA